MAECKILGVGLSELFREGIIPHNTIMPSVYIYSQVILTFCHTLLYFKLVPTSWPLQAEGYFYCIYFQCLCFQRSCSCFIFNYFMCSQIMLSMFSVCISYCFLYSLLLAKFSNLGASVSLLFISKWFMVILIVFALSHQGSVLSYLRLVRYFRKCLSCGLPCHLCRGRNHKNVSQILR